MVRKRLSPLLPYKSFSQPENVPKIGFTLNIWILRIKPMSKKYQKDFGKRNKVKEKHKGFDQKTKGQW